MSVPGYLSSSYRSASYVTITDVNDIISNLRTELVTNNNPAWTETSPATTFKSPVDSDGRFFEIKLTRVAAQNLQMDVIDQNGVTVSQRRMQISSTFNRITIFSGQYHVCIDAMRSDNTAEYLLAGILDFYPQPQSANARYTYGGGTRTTGDTASTNSWSYAGMLDNVTVSWFNRCNIWASPGSCPICYTLSGNILYHPREFFASTAALSFAYAGRGYQQIILPNSLGDFETLVKVPLSDSIAGQFRVAQGIPGYMSQLLAYRVG
jgi:hypothetical protein